MTIYLSAALVAAVYAAAGAFLFFRGKPQKGSNQYKLMNINTTTKKGKRRFIEHAARMAREAAEQERDGIQ